MSLRVQNKLWIISDTHFGHKNIIRFAQRPETHEVIMLSNWIDRVKDGDQVLHLGDVFAGKQGNPDRWAKVLSRMPGEKFLIKGNHDPTDDTLFEKAGFEIVQPFIFTPKKEPLKGIPVAITHEPIGTKWSPGGFRLEDWHVNLHGHCHRGAFGDFSVIPKEIDGEPIEGKQYVNACVEWTDLAPMQLGSLLGRVKG